MFVSSLLYTVILGAVVGLIWALALSARISLGVAVGAIAGAVASALLAAAGNLARRGSRLEAGETSFVSNSLVTAASIVGFIVGLVVWVTRLALS